MAKRKSSRRRRKINLTPFQTVVFSLVGLCLVLGLWVSAAGEVGAAPTWQEIYTAVGLADPLPAADLPENTDAVHFIDVGQADATLLQSGGEYCLVDAEMCIRDSARAMAMTGGSSDQAVLKKRLGEVT